MRQIPPIALITAFTAAAGCTSQPSDPVANEIFIATVDGHPFVADTIDIVLYRDSVLQIRALQYPLGNGIGFLVSVDSFAVPATYSLRDPATQKWATFQDYSVLRLAYLTGPSDPGTLTLQAIDTVRRIIEGEYSFVAHGYLPQQQDSSARVVGTFRYDYVREPDN